MSQTTTQNTTELPLLILQTLQARLISEHVSDSVVYTKRLKKGTYALSDGRKTYGTITLTTRPQRMTKQNIKTYLDSISNFTTVEKSRLPRTLYIHEKIEFVKETQIKNDSQSHNIPIQSTIDSMTFPAEVYIIKQSCTSGE